MSQRITSLFQNQQGWGINSRLLKNNYQKLTSLCLLFLLLFQVIGGVFLFVPKTNEVKADAPISWYNSSWLHRKAIPINGSTAGAQTNYQVSVPVTYNANMKADFSDIRFADADGATLLNYWMESSVASTSANFYVKILSIPASPAAATIYMYYGNVAATSASNGDDTFDFFDGFDDPPEWQTLATLPFTIADHTAAVLNGKIYIIGGYNNTATDPRAEMWAYNPIANSYTQKTSLNAARWGPMAVPFGGKIYVFGGAGTSGVNLNAEVYDPSNDTWTNKAMPPVGIRTQGVFGTADANYIYLFLNNYLYRYDTSLDTYTLLNSTPPNSIFSWGTMVNYNNRLYLFGGYSAVAPAGARDYVMIYNLGTSSWEASGAPMPVALYGHLRESPIINDKVYILQGQRASGEFFSRYWVYNITTNSWSWGNLGHWDADGVAGGVIGNKIYTFGGRRDTVGPYGTNYAEVLDTTLASSAKWIDIKGTSILSNSAITKKSGTVAMYLSTANQVISTNKRVISKIKYSLSGSSTAGWGGLVAQANNGTYASNLNGYLSPYIDKGANGDVLYKETGANFSLLGSSSLASADIWHTYVSKYGPSNIILTRDGTAIVSASDSTYRGGYIQIITGNAVNFNMSVDYVAVGNYVSTEPAFGSFGSEETMDHFVITGAISQVAGTTQTITLTAKTNLGNTYACTEDKTITFSGASAIGVHHPTFIDKGGHEVNFGSAGTIAFTNGVATVDISLYKDELAEIEAIDGTNSTSGDAGYDLNVDVSPGTLAIFDATSPSDIISETPFSISLTAKDSSGNTTTNVTHPTTLSVSYGAIDITSIPNTEFQDDGAYTNNITISEIYADRNIVLTIRNGSITQTINLAVTGVSSIDHLTITGNTSQTAGTTQTITLTAKTNLGNTYTSYTGDKTLTLSGPFTIDSNIPTFTDKDSHTVNFGSSGTIHFTDGIATTDIKLYKAENTEIDATDGTNSTNGDTSYDLNVSVSPNTINSFNITSPSNITSETPFSISLTSKDSSGNTTTGVASPTTLSVSYGAIDIASIPNTEFQDAGAYTNNITISEIYADRNIILTIRNGSIAQTINLTVTGMSHGTGFTPPPKPIVTPTDLTSGTVPSNITQIAISKTPDFANVSWQPFDKDKFKNIDQTTETLYVKFRTDQGAVSDTIIYEAKPSIINSNPTIIPLIEGDIVKTPNNPDVYVIKYKNNKQYKRLILSPLVFKSYQHLKWENIKIVSQEQLDKYTTSNLVKETIDTIIYQLFPNGDIGERKAQDTSINYDSDSVYEINAVDRDSYKLVK